MSKKKLNLWLTCKQFVSLYYSEGVKDMIDSVRNNPNAGGLTVHDQKKSSISSGQANRAPDIVDVQADNSSVDLDLSLSEKVSSLAGSPPVNMGLVNDIREKELNKVDIQSI